MRLMLVTAAVMKKDGKFLVARRRDNCPREPGKWEFPGGKVENGETPQESLRREIMEELGLKIMVGEPACVSSVAGGGKQIVLMAFWAEILEGEPKALDCAGFRWVEAGRLKKMDWAEADKPIVQALSR